MNYFWPGSVKTHWGPEPVNKNLVPGPVNTNWGPEPVNTNLVPGTVNTNWGPGPVNINWGPGTGPGAKQRVGGQETQITVKKPFCSS